MSTLITPDIELPAQVDEAFKTRFLTDGFARIDDVIEPEELAFYRRKYDELFDENRTDIKRKQLGGKDADGKELLPQIIGAHTQAPEMFETRYVERIKAIAGFLLGEEAELRGSHMILKPAGHGSITPWHQDQAYHGGARKVRYRNVNFWLPMDDATEANGCMQYVRGSHLGPIVPHEFLNGDRDAAMVAQDQGYWHANRTVVECPAGSVTIHHSYCMHYAGANTTNQARRALIIVFKGGGNSAGTALGLALVGSGQGMRVGG